MSTKVYLRTGVYLVLIWVGYLLAEYPAIPSFDLLGWHHVQPDIHVYDMGIAAVLLIWSIVLLLKFWSNIWIRFSMVFITWGMVGNLIDEVSGHAELFSIGEQIALLMALLTTSTLIYRKWRTR